MTYTFTGSVARPQPTISSIVDGASLVTGTFAPGSYISLVGSGLSDLTDAHLSAPHPLAIDSVSVSFDVPSARLSVPGHLIYASPNWINVQVRPGNWRAKLSVQVKVNVDFSPSNVFTIALAPVAPAFFLMGGGSVWARDLNYNAINAGDPAHAGETIQLFANGLGPVTNQPASGDPAPDGPFAGNANPGGDDRHTASDGAVQRPDAGIRHVVHSKRGGAAVSGAWHLSDCGFDWGADVASRLHRCSLDRSPDAVA